MTIGVEPANPGNVVTVPYRVDGGPIRKLEARELRTDYGRQVQYFLASFPDDLGGKRVEYCPELECVGRRVPGFPAPAWSAFSLAPKSRTHEEHGVSSERLSPRFEPILEFVGQVTVQLKPPVVIGKTPQGLRLDYYARSGTLKTRWFTAQVLEDSVDYMVVRPDGVGMIDIHATLRLDDGALLSVTESGVIDFGPDGFERVARGEYPELPEHQVSPRVLTADARYAWMNRTQFVGVGHVTISSLILEYDIFSVKTGLRARRS